MVNDNVSYLIVNLLRNRPKYMKVLTYLQTVNIAIVYRNKYIEVYVNGYERVKYRGLLSTSNDEGLPRYVIVAYMIQEAELRLKSPYEIEDVGDGFADVFGYCANIHSLSDFQESFPSTEDKEETIRKAGRIIKRWKMKALGSIIPYLLVHSWYPSSIFSQTSATFPTNVFGALMKLQHFVGIQIPLAGIQRKGQVKQM
ncbi:hypothetical protein BDC45DRAFT_562798 [Circinella umbellata]|nr:hypothetical protein BDC45DRAFT_562798 [Circinella umbellata]